MHRVVGLPFFAFGVVLATTALPLRRQHQPQLAYSSLANCISDGRCRDPLVDLHPELVNAPYTRAGYEVGVG